MTIRPTSFFLRELKRLSKKYPSIRADLAQLAASLENDPMQGTPLRRGAFKIRMAITSKGSGKSGGSRVITCVRMPLDRIYLLDIYDKSERANISDTDLDYFIDMIDEIIE
jgi:mRNA-degrading endonuclease RelE of RelBE toxin-antitoxin system